MGPIEVISGNTPHFAVSGPDYQAYGDPIDSAPVPDDLFRLAFFGHWAILS